MTGEPGIVAVADESTITLTGLIGAGDPLRENLVTPGPLALLAIDLRTRSRYRVNGTAEAESHDRIRLSVREAFGNCPKYIKVRRLEPAGEAAPVRVGDAAALNADQRRFIEAADTFFIATHADGGADASHRGGRPGFVTVESDGTLVIPDYTGNNMFQTLGNIERCPSRAPVPRFRDRARASATGAASIDWDESHAAAFAGAHRLLRVSPRPRGRNPRSAGGARPTRRAVAVQPLIIFQVGVERFDPALYR
jgi:hypothetical protein